MDILGILAILGSIIIFPGGLYWFPMVIFARFGLAQQKSTISSLVSVDMLVIGTVCATLVALIPLPSLPIYSLWNNSNSVTSIIMLVLLLVLAMGCSGLKLERLGQQVNALLLPMGLLILTAIAATQSLYVIDSLSTPSYIWARSFLGTAIVVSALSLFSELAGSIWTKAVLQSSLIFLGLSLMACYWISSYPILMVALLGQFAVALTILGLNFLQRFPRVVPEIVVLLFTVLAVASAVWGRVG